MCPRLDRSSASSKFFCFAPFPSNCLSFFGKMPVAFFGLAFLPSLRHENTYQPTKEIFTHFPVAHSLSEHKIYSFRVSSDSVQWELGKSLEMVLLPCWLTGASGKQV